MLLIWLEFRFYIVGQPVEDFLQLDGVLHIAEGCAGFFSAQHAAKLFPWTLHIVA